ncbi:MULTISPECIES: amino acid ABC transporter permease [Pantoea]|uniref:amino acid ABC transporter permease n=1 Tax=Pantoea TaxID=53335 RepID=UPI000DA677B0|nr:amino acid ABC transporter permease [Pantoea ananatis]MCW0307795.1 L-cystine transport system permease protein YecS [Pantoea ananatis]MCW0339795.1 L-cystine transport system permease protein YecS [Pantoea ananatis]MCW0357863.1 L-cystine transport system permease protein YecS [Pantoea ananatis]MCW0362486.1 L-cystine transport system permease protein YecS [Pantoea ananatis]PZD68646.1 amino acid ABC transporter permease [Pantoea ananatis]
MDWSSVHVYLPFLLQGAEMTIYITILSLLISTPLGLVLAAAKMCPFKIISWPVSVIINITRDLPMIVVLFYIYFVFPDIGITLTSFQASVVGIAFCFSTFLAEIFRSGIESVDRGQLEAARSMGMSFFKAMRRVILPQAFHVALPPYSNTLVMMLKDSALASTIAVTEMTRQAASTFDNTTVYTLVALLYLTLCMPLLAFTKHLENRQKKGA